MELTSHGYAAWARYVELGYHPNSKLTWFQRLLRHIFQKRIDLGASYFYGDQHMINFILRVTNKRRNYNCCYATDEDGEFWIKDECADCKYCVIDDLFFEAICDNKELCENG